MAVEPAGSQSRLVSENCDLGLAVVDDRDLVDLPDTNAGDAHLVALVERGDVGEDCVELGAAAAAELAMRGGQRCLSRGS